MRGDGKEPNDDALQRRAIQSPFASSFNNRRAQLESVASASYLAVTSNDKRLTNSLRKDKIRNPNVKSNEFHYKRVYFFTVGCITRKSGHKNWIQMRRQNGA